MDVDRVWENLARDAAREGSSNEAALLSVHSRPAQGPGRKHATD